RSEARFAYSPAPPGLSDTRAAVCRESRGSNVIAVCLTVVQTGVAADFDGDDIDLRCVRNGSAGMRSGRAGSPYRLYSVVANPGNVCEGGAGMISEFREVRVPE